VPEQSLKEIAAELRRVKRPVLAGHVMPDGDSIGSTLALGLILEKLGVAATLVSQDEIPANYRFLPGTDRIHVGRVPDGHYDALIALDCSVPDRLGPAVMPLLSQPGIRVINLDHHLSAIPFADLSYVDPAAAAVGEIVFDLAELLKVALTPEIAACLYTAILTDTGSFRYENTGPDTHRRVARLIEHGIDVAAISTKIYDERPVAVIRLLHLVLGTLRLSKCGRIAWLKLTRSMEAASGSGQADAENLINYTRTIKGVEVGLLFREMPDNQIKVGFRSKRRIDVSQLAAAFGGGGHPRAAGCTLPGSLAEVEMQVVAAVEKAVAEACDGRGS